MKDPNVSLQTNFSRKAHRFKAKNLFYSSLDSELLWQVFSKNMKRPNSDHDYENDRSTKDFFRKYSNLVRINNRCQLESIWRSYLDDPVYGDISEMLATGAEAGYIVRPFFNPNSILGKKESGESVLFSIDLGDCFDSSFGYGYCWSKTQKYYYNIQFNGLRKLLESDHLRTVLYVDDLNLSRYFKEKLQIAINLKEKYKDFKRLSDWQGDNFIWHNLYNNVQALYFSEVGQLLRDLVITPEALAFRKYKETIKATNTLDAVYPKKEQEDADYIQGF